MDRGQGTTWGAVLIAALLFRSGIPHGQTNPDVQPAAATSAAASAVTSTKAPGEGPWAASCRYWAPNRLYVPSPPEEEEVGAVDLVHKGADARDYHVTVKDPSKTWSCKDATNPWGVPDGQSGDVIIAIVPDPVVSSTPLKFDRAIDALLTAAARRRQRYQSSFYWLPWQPTTSRGSRNEESTSWQKKSSDPGLIILRSLRTEDSSVPDTVLYVFLVGETPTSGINGEQMQRALTYRKQLKTLFLPHSTEPDILRVIGPTFSGSAPSLARALADTCATIRGSTGTALAVQYLASPSCPATTYQSFLDDNAVTSKTFITALVQSGIHPNQISLLVEQGTTLGAASGSRKKIADTPDPDRPKEDPATPNSDRPKDPDWPKDDCVPNTPDCYNVIQFPRNIFLLRNAYEQRNATPQELATPSPYLQLKLNSSTPTDDIPNFDTQMMPLSQEAQLMAIQHQLSRYHTKYILIWGSSNVLDQIFLAQYFHRALPDARIVFNASDLLIERETDNAKLIGSLTVTSYHLIGLGNPENPGFGGFAFPNADSDSYYNATTSVLCAIQNDCRAEDFIAYKPVLVSRPQGTLVKPPLWVTATGTDGYYPLGILAINCDLKLDTKTTPKPIANSDAKPKHEFDAMCNPKLKPDFNMPKFPLGQAAAVSRFPLHPSSVWFLLCALITLACIFHVVILSVADYWSPFTRWVAIRQNDDPQRLSVYINIGTVALFSMACIISIPLFVCTFTIVRVYPWAVFFASMTLFTGLVALIATIRKTGSITWKLLWYKKNAKKANHLSKKAPPTDKYFYRLFHWMVVCACVFIPGAWFVCCFNLTQENQLAAVGSCFAFRCLYPQSGVSPLLPTIIVLGTWHLWAVIHTLRHRFSLTSRPLMPLPQRRDAVYLSYPLYVADSDLIRNDPLASLLVSNSTSLLITRELFMRFATNCRDAECHNVVKNRWHRVLVAAYLFAFVLALFLPIIHTLDSMLWTIGGIRPDIWASGWHESWRFKLTPFELLNRALFFPLLVIMLTNWIRMVVVWGSLKRGVLQRLEQSPLRFAFDSIKGTLRLSLFKQSGMREQWNDMARSTESIRQLINDDKNTKCVIMPEKDRDALFEKMKTHNEELNSRIRKVMKHLGGRERVTKHLPLEKVISRLWNGSPAVPSSRQNSPSALVAVPEVKSDTKRLGRIVIALIRRIWNYGNRPVTVENKYILEIEKCYQKLSTDVLSHILIPYWWEQKRGLIDSTGERPDIPKSESKSKALSLSPTRLALKWPGNVVLEPVPSTDPRPCEKSCIEAAEEFIAFRYLALIRAVLVNLRYIMIFVTTSFVLAITAWNSYPFQPRQFFNWIFTIVLILLGSGTVVVLMQMYHDPLLSRITNKNPNELGWDFFMKVASVVGLPLLSWLAYYYPEIGDTLFKIFRSGTAVVK
jgi:hypothetical protein